MWDSSAPGMTSNPTDVLDWRSRVANGAWREPQQKVVGRSSLTFPLPVIFQPLFESVLPALPTTLKAYLQILSVAFANFVKVDSNCNHQWLSDFLGRSFRQKVSTFLDFMLYLVDLGYPLLER